MHCFAVIAGGDCVIVGTGDNQEKRCFLRSLNSIFDQAVGGMSFSFVLQMLESNNSAVIMFLLHVQLQPSPIPSVKIPFLCGSSNYTADYPTGDIKVKME